METHEKGQVVASAAQVYEQFFVPALFADWPPRVVAAAGVKAGDAVLDVACGTGVLAREALRHVGTAGSVVGVDVNDEMLAVAKRLSNIIEWRKDSAENLPFADNTFDHTLSQFGLMFFQARAQAIREMRRVTKPGGTVCIAVWAALANTPGYAAVAKLLHDLFGAEIAQSIEAPFALGNLTTLKTLFAEAGEHNLSISTVTGKARFNSLEEWVFTDIKGWTLADAINDTDYAALLDASKTRLSSFVLPDETVAFDAPAHLVTFVA